jgi:hypothetical protein
MKYFKESFKKFKQIFLFHLDLIISKKNAIEVFDQNMQNRLLKRLYDFWQKNVKDKE